jgi:hypothetical protein
MNICGNGICVCDNYERGEDGCSQSGQSLWGELPAERFYYSGLVHNVPGVVFSIDDQSDMLPGVKYYKDPNLKELA